MHTTEQKLASASLRRRNERVKCNRHNHFLVLETLGLLLRQALYMVETVVRAVFKLTLTAMKFLQISLSKGDVKGFLN